MVMPPRLAPLTLSPVERVILVTGSTDGIGAETALTLARDPKHRVVVHGRDEERSRATVRLIQEATGNTKVERVTANFTDLRQVEAMAAELEERFPAIHTLVCNAGVLLPVQQVTKDGYEMTMAVNHTAHFLLSSLLLERLKASGKPEHHARVVAVSSVCHSWERMDFEDLNCTHKPYEKYEQYSRSKLANVMFACALARRLEAEGAPVTANVLEPGVVATKLLRSGGIGGGGPVANGAKAPVYLASSAEVEGVTGQYFSSACRATECAPIARMVNDQERLWRLSNAMCADVLGADFEPIP